MALCQCHVALKVTSIWYFLWVLQHGNNVTLEKQFSSKYFPTHRFSNSCIFLLYTVPCLFYLWRNVPEKCRSIRQCLYWGKWIQWGRKMTRLELSHYQHYHLMNYTQSRSVKTWGSWKTIIFLFCSLPISLNFMRKTSYKQATLSQIYQNIDQKYMLLIPMLLAKYEWSITSWSGYDHHFQKRKRQKIRQAKLKH